MLPPRLTASYGHHGSSDLAVGLAAAWLLRRAKAFVVTANVTSPSKKAGISVHRATR